MRVEDIPTKRRGDPLLAEEVNALADQARAHSRLSQRWGEPEGEKLRSRTRWFEAVNADDEECPPYSVFGVYAGTTEDNDPPRVHIKRIGKESLDAPHLALLTNGDTAIGVNEVGLVRAINMWETARISGASGGMWCGPNPAGSWSLQDNRFGFFALGPSVISGVLEVIRAVEPITLVVKTLNCITARSGDTMGNGLGQIHFRVSGSLLETVENMGSVPIWNLCEYEVTPETYVQVGAALGVGLVIMPCGPGSCGSEGSVSSSSGSFAPPSSSSSFAPPSSSSPGSASSGSFPLPSSSGPCFGIPGVDLDALPIGVPAYVLGIDADGCLIRVPTGQCGSSGS